MVKTSQVVVYALGRNRRICLSEFEVYLVTIASFSKGCIG